MTLYWYKTGADSLWATLAGNWWDDALHTDAAAALPTVDDDVIIVAGSPTPPTVALDSWVAPASITGSPVFTSVLGTGATAVDIIGNPVFTSGGNTGEIVGNPTFNGTSFAKGLITGNPIFNEASHLHVEGRIVGSPVFNGNSYIQSPVSGGHITFNDHASIVGSQVTVETTEGLRGMRH